MQFIHTFYSKPLLANKFNKYDTLINVIISDYTYSAMCIKRSGNSIILYTDKIGANILSHIPYDEIKIIDFNESVDFAASIKFEAIKLMRPNDVLIDGDLFIQKEKSFQLLEEYKDYDFIYSFFEPTTYTIATEHLHDYYTKLIYKLHTKAEYFQPPYELPTHFEQLSWPNTSLMRFNNMDLKEEYMRQYMFFKDKLKDIDFEETWPDIIIEQYNMKSLLNTAYTSKAMIEDFPTVASNDYALEIGFTHLGSGKVKFNDYFRERTRQDFPREYELMNKQIEKFQKNKPE